MGGILKTGTDSYWLLLTYERHRVVFFWDGQQIYFIYVREACAHAPIAYLLLALAYKAGRSEEEDQEEEQESEETRSSFRFC